MRSRDRTPDPGRVRTALRHGAVVRLAAAVGVLSLRTLAGDPIGPADAVRAVGWTALLGAVVAVRRHRDVGERPSPADGVRSDRSDGSPPAISPG